MSTNNAFPPLPPASGGTCGGGIFDGAYGGAPRASTMAKVCPKPGQERNPKTGRCVLVSGPNGTVVKRRRSSPVNNSLFGPSGTVRKPRRNSGARRVSSSVKQQLFSPQRSSRSSGSRRRSSVGGVQGALDALDEHTSNLFKRVEVLERSVASMNENVIEDIANLDRKVAALESSVGAAAKKDKED